MVRYRVGDEKLNNNLHKLSGVLEPGYHVLEERQELVLH